MFTEKIKKYVNEKRLSSKTAQILRQFYEEYLRIVVRIQEISEKEAIERLDLFLSLILNQIKTPYSFGLFHKKITTPFNYYQFGLEIMRPLLNKKQSKVFGLGVVDRMQEFTSAGENIILLANHQTEPDPQWINILLEETHKEFISEIIFIAGNRVVSDPIAAPLSMGCNLICIYSKKHMNSPPDQKQDKLQHNQRAMKKLLELLSEGGQCIYVAPSGGRDRLDKRGIPLVAPFDPNNIELFYLISRKAKKKTHFIPLSLYTYPLLPPPEKVEEEIGEWRKPSYSPAHLYFGDEIDMENISKTSTKENQRKERAEMIWNIVRKNYEVLLSIH